jgi:hypothetical protein
MYVVAHCPRPAAVYCRCGVMEVGRSISVLVYGTTKIAKLDSRFSSAVNEKQYFLGSSKQQQRLQGLFCEVDGARVSVANIVLSAALVCGVESTWCLQLLKPLGPSP